MNNNLEHFPDLPPDIGILYLSGNPFTKKPTELRKMVEYINENNCESDIEDIIDLKTYYATKLLTKKETNIDKLPKVISNKVISYSLAG